MVEFTESPSLSKLAKKMFIVENRKFLSLEKKNKKIFEKIQLSILEKKINNKFFSIFAEAANDYGELDADRK